MLIEMTSPVFKEKGKERPPIRFKEGLNVVLGKEDGENSIGKSSAMLAIDFVFGGNAYLSSDGVKHIGDHTIFFTFEFDGKPYYFARNTASPDDIHICSEGYQLTGDAWTKQEFANWLKEKYHIDFSGLSFRETMSSFFRIYGKENTDERRPLKGLPGESMQKSIDILVKLFDRYKDVEVFNGRLEEQKKKLAAYREARKYRFVPDLVGGKTQYDENVAQIRSLQVELDNLTAEQVEDQKDVDIEKSRIKSQLQASKLRLETEMQSKQRRLSLLNMSLEYGLYPTEADLSALQEFFPEVNIRKLYEVEKYHQKLAAILDEQFSAERQSVEGEIANLQEQIKALQTQISELGFVGNLSKEFLDKHSEIKGRIDALKAQNEAYLTLTDLQDARKKADEMLKRAIEDILADIERSINDKMKEFNDSLFTESRKAPNLHFNEYNSYRFETPDDTGTGSNYKGMVVYDLAVLYLTALPAIAHDSLILKNIGDGAVDGIMKIYAQSRKQVFIAFDKQAAYMPDTQKILADNTVLKLSDGNCELYGESWNKEVSQNEDEL
nr:DUF2326 domain-containing protein [Clostridia bacterium]